MKNRACGRRARQNRVINRAQLGESMQELRFEDDTRFTLQVGEQVWLQRSIGGHELHCKAAIGVSSLTEAGKLLVLEATLFGFAAPRSTGHAWAGSPRTWPTPRSSPSTGSLSCSR